MHEFPCPAGSDPCAANPVLDAMALGCERDQRRLFAGLSFRLRADDMLRIRGFNGSGKNRRLSALQAIPADRRKCRAVQSGAERPGIRTVMDRPCRRGQGGVDRRGESGLAPCLAQARRNCFNRTGTGRGGFARLRGHALLCAVRRACVCRRTGGSMTRQHPSD